MTKVRNAEQRFWPRVNKTDTCWLWTGSLVGEGYGRITDDNGRSAFVHRFAYELLVGPVPGGKQLDHLCRVRACVNPTHLEPVTRRENILRGVSPQAENARKTYCDNGHALEGYNVYRSAMGRSCRVCRNAAARRYRDGHREQVTMWARRRWSRGGALGEAK